MRTATCRNDHGGSGGSFGSLLVDLNVCLVQHRAEVEPVRSAVHAGEVRPLGIKCVLQAQSLPVPEPD